MSGLSADGEPARWPPLQLDRRFVRKYDGPGPRYTSYPSAPAFRDNSFGPAEHAALLAASARGGAPLSLYVHVPFCATRCLFCGCNVVISRDRGWGERYLPLLEREMEMAARRGSAPSTARWCRSTGAAARRPSCRRGT